jgi:hypothetical protein
MYNTIKCFYLLTVANISEILPITTVKINKKLISPYAVIRYVATTVKLDILLTLAPDVSEWSAAQPDHVMATEKPLVPI